MKKKVWIYMLASTLMTVFFTSTLLIGAFYIAPNELNYIPAIVVAILICFATSYFFAIKLTKAIIKPLNNIDLKKEQVEIYDELSPFVRKIKKQKKHINKQSFKLQDRKNMIKTMTKNMKEGMLLLDVNGAILLANKSVLDLFDANGADYIGKNTIEFMRNMELQKAIKRALLGESCDIIIEIRKETIQVFLSPVVANGQANGAIALFLDISAKVSAEKMRKEFSANVSHELKTPVTTIAALSEMIINDMVKPDDIKNFAGKIRDESARLISLIEDIIKISEIDENTSERQFSNFDLSTLAREVASRLHSTADLKNVAITVVGEETNVYANNQMMFELIYNLVDNAIKYNKQDGLVEVTITNENGKTKLEVYDTGIGIETLHFNRVFERFYRVDKSRSKKTGGTGLGLSIVKHIVEYHGGTVTIQSKAGQFARVTVII